MRVLPLILCVGIGGLLGELWHRADPPSQPPTPEVVKVPDEVCNEQLATSIETTNAQIKVINSLIDMLWDYSYEEILLLRKHMGKPSHLSPVTIPRTIEPVGELY